VAVLLLFLLLLVVAVGLVVAFLIDEPFAIVLHGCFQRLAFGGFALALPAPLVPGVEDLVQLGDHLLDRRQLAGRSRFAARALRTGRTLRPRLGLRARLALLALRPGLSRHPRLAARAVRTAPTRMTLRPRPSRFALPPAWTRRSLPSVPALVVCHVAAPGRDALLLSGVLRRQQLGRRRGRTDPLRGVTR
jgi:hypothetical protein